jgi:hypothetical protein
MAKGKLPITKRIKLASNVEQWILIENELIKELPCSAMIDRGEDSTVKIQLMITAVKSPKKHGWNSSVEIGGTKNLKMKNGLERIQEFFTDLLHQDIWILTGYIDGSNRVPILILYYEIFETSVYTIKFEKESYADFLPDGVLPPKN